MRSKIKDQTIGTMELAAGTASYILGTKTQEYIVKAFEVSQETGLALYNEMVLEHGKGTIDYLITSGEDLGVLAIVYGADAILKHYEFAKFISLSIRLATPLVGLVIELTQLFPDSVETFSIPDLLLFLVPLLYEVKNIKKTVNDRFYSSQ